MYLIGHKSNPGRFQKGINHPKWKNGEYINEDGYKMILDTRHPNAYGSRYVLEHRLIMEKAVGRYLTKDEVIHHINKNRQDNRIENLEIVDRSKHNVIHFTVYKKDRICYNCNSKTYIDRLGEERWFKNPENKEQFLCRKCYRKKTGK